MMKGDEHNPAPHDNYLAGNFAEIRHHLLFDRLILKNSWNMVKYIHCLNNVFRLKDISLLDDLHKFIITKENRLLDASLTCGCKMKKLCYDAKIWMMPAPSACTLLICIGKLTAPDCVAQKRELMVLLKYKHKPIDLKHKRIMVVWYDYNRKLGV